MRHAAAFIFKTEKLANNNQFNYPQNIYCRIGFVIQPQRRREEMRSDFLLHRVRPFSRRFVVVIARFSVRCFTQSTYLRALTHRSCTSAPICTHHADLRWVCHICCFVSCLLSCSEQYGLVLECPTGLCVILASHEYLLVLLRTLVLHFCALSVWLGLRWSCASQYNYLSSRRSSAAGAPASPTLHKKDRRPGDDISEIMSIFTHTAHPLPLERRERMRSFQIPSHHLSFTAWVQPRRAVMNYHLHLAEDRYRL